MPRNELATSIVVSNALVDRIEVLERKLADADRHLGNALSVIERMEKYLDDGYGGGWFELWAMSNDHQLYDDLLGLPARRTNTNAES